MRIWGFWYTIDPDLVNKFRLIWQLILFSVIIM